MPSYLLTGAAGFIGYWVARRLLAEGARVTGIDSLNDAYDPRLKRWRFGQLERHDDFRIVRADVADREELGAAADGCRFSAVFHLAARAGAPQSVANPHAYVRDNVTGTQNVLDLCTSLGIPKLVMASTSSVYGVANRLPIGEDADTGRPRSPYAASKKAAELLARAHHHVHGLDVTVVRYFTVFGPAGRPDMSLFRFIRWIREGEPIVLHGDGSQSRDFTYVEDVARGTIRARRPLGFEVVNLGSDSPAELRAAIGMIEGRLGRKAKVRRASLHRVDVPATWADIGKARRLLDWEPRTSLRDGIGHMVDWYLDNRDWARHIELP